MRVDINQFLQRGRPTRRPLAADQHPVRRVQVRHGGALGEKFGVRQHFEAMAARVRIQNVLDGLRGLHGDRGLLDDNLGAVGVLGDRACNRLDEPQVGRAAGADAVGLGRRVDGHKYDVGRLDRAFHVSGKTEIPTAGLTHDLVEARFVDGQPVGIPGGDARRVHVDHPHLDLRRLKRDHRHRWPTHVTGSNAANFHAFRAADLEATRANPSLFYGGGA